MNKPFTFALKTTRFDEHYQPSTNTRTTTNFANLARGSKRKDNLRLTLDLINQRFNSLASWDNPNGERYAVTLDIVSVELEIEGAGQGFPSLEILKTTIHDKRTQTCFDGIVGNNFSSYIRDYDFSVVLKNHNNNRRSFSIPDDFGELHGILFQSFVQSQVYKQHFKKLPVICLSVSESKMYHRTDNSHPVLGVEYNPESSSLTEQYFKKMGLQVRYFMPPNSVAPFAFYFFGDLLNDYTHLELVSTISTMETFQKIYRPEIYNANTPAGQQYQASLTHHDHTRVPVFYDREERSVLAVEQGEFAEKHFIQPFRHVLKQLSPANVG